MIEPATSPTSGLPMLLKKVTNGLWPASYDV
jgi:hypothetical protein